MARLRAVFLLGVTLGLLTGCGSSGGNDGGGTTPPPPSTGSLTITVSELPSGASASITVSGPSGYSASVTSTQTLQVAPGSYTVAASSVSAGKSNYYPAIASQSATVAVSTTASVTVDYATIIPTTTKALDAAGKSSLTVSSDGSTITMSTSSAVAASLQANDILASGITTGAPNGLLVKIMSVSTSGQTVTASVEPATLEQAIQQGTLQYSATLDTTNTTSSAYLPKASSRSRRLPGSRRLSRSLAQPDATATGACANNSNTLKYPYPSVPIVETPNASWTLLGESDFCPTISFAAKISAFGIESASATATLGVHNAIGVEGMANGEFNPAYTFPAITSAPIEVPIGPIVVVVQASITSFLGLDGSATASAYAGITTDSTASVSLSYANGVWTPSGSASPTVVQPVTSVDGQVSVKAYAGLKAGVLIYGTVTPYLSVDDYLQFQAGLNMNPCWNLKAGVEGSVGISGTAFGKDFDYATTPLNLFPAIPIAQSTGTCFMPVLSAISPTTATAGSGQLTLAVTGSNFVPASTVNLNGQALATTYVDTNNLTAMVPASALVSTGTFPVTVNSPDSPGGTSTQQQFTVAAVSICPTSAVLNVGTGVSFVAAATGIPPTGFNWSVNSVAGGSESLGKITASGEYTAPASPPTPATVSILATSSDYPNISGTAPVTVSQGSFSWVRYEFPPGTSAFENFPIVNDSGQVLINPFFEESFSGEAYIINGCGEPITLDSHQGSIASNISGFNDHGVMVGTYSDTNGYSHGFVITNGAFSTLDSPVGFGTEVWGISEGGIIVGNFWQDSTDSSGKITQEEYLFTYYNGVFTNFLAPGTSVVVPNTSTFGVAESYAPYGVNDSGKIVGTVLSASGQTSQGFTAKDGAFNVQCQDCVFFGINNNGVVSGQSDNGPFEFDGVNFISTGYPSEVDVVGGGINNKGQLVGTAIDSKGSWFIYVATPVN